MSSKPFQYSLASLLLLITACAVLLSFVKTFPEASLRITELGLMAIGPLLFFVGGLLVFHGEIFFRRSRRFARVYSPLIGLACIIAGLLWFVFLS